MIREAPAMTVRQNLGELRALAYAKIRRPSSSGSRRFTTPPVRPTRIGVRANDFAVPPGWVAQRGLYQQVIAPYCGSCHFAQSGALCFGSWAEVQQLKQAIQRVVCTDFTMPHSEILFRKFWTQTGAVSPGLLSTSLGFPKCRQ